jgi:transposase
MSETYKSETLEHLGLVAGMFDELGIGELVDELVPQDLEQRTVSVGQALKAMVLNGLGFANRRLYRRRGSSRTNQPGGCWVQG